VHVHALRIAFGAIISSSILEVANQFLLLGVDGDDGLLLGLRRNDFRADVFELGVSVRMFRASSALRFDWRENPSFTNSVRTLSALIGCPICVRVAASFSMLFDTQIKGRMGSPSVAGSTRRLSAGRAPDRSREAGDDRHRTANLPLRQRLCIEITLAAIDRRTGEPGDFRDNRETASTSSPHLGRRKQSPPPLIKLRANRVPPQPNGGLVDHATDLPRFAENRNPQHLSQSDARSADDDSVIVRSVLSRQLHTDGPSVRPPITTRDDDSALSALRVLINTFADGRGSVILAC